MASNPAGASRLPSSPPVRRVAELGSLIWLEMVKQKVALLSESFHFIRLLRHRGFSDSEAGTLYGCSMLRYVSPLVAVTHNEVIHTARSDAALLLILGTWFGLVTAN